MRDNQYIWASFFVLFFSIFGCFFFRFLVHFLFLFFLFVCFFVFCFSLKLKWSLGGWRVFCSHGCYCVLSCGHVSEWKHLQISHREAWINKLSSLWKRKTVTTCEAKLTSVLTSLPLPDLLEQTACSCQLFGTLRWKALTDVLIPCGLGVLSWGLSVIETLLIEGLTIVISLWHNDNGKVLFFCCSCFGVKDFLLFLIPSSPCNHLHMHHLWPDIYRSLNPPREVLSAVSSVLGKHDVCMWTYELLQKGGMLFD